MIKFHCPHCNRKLGVPDEAAGRRIRCVDCKEVCAVPAVSPAENGEETATGTKHSVANSPTVIVPALNAAVEAARGTSGAPAKAPSSQPNAANNSGAPTQRDMSGLPGATTPSGSQKSLANNSKAPAKPAPNREMQVNRIQEITCSGCRHKINISAMTPLQQANCPDCGVAFQVPCQIGQYILVKRVASGAMGSVYVAFDETLNRQVALKVVNAPPSKDDNLYQGALRESRILASLNHPNIAQIYSMSEDMGQPYITMELVDGNSVLELIKKGDSIRTIAEAELRANPAWNYKDDTRFRDHTPTGRLSDRRTCEVMIDASAGLSYAYQMGYIHRDIKPGNLLLDRQGRTKIIDFGLAETASKQVEGKVMGSPYYMPPEIARGQKADCRADIFSLGATMWHMLAGTPPYQAPTPKDVILKRFKEAPANLAEHYGVNPYLANLVAWMMNVAPEDRPASYMDLIDKLTKALMKLDEAGEGK